MASIVSFAFFALLTPATAGAMSCEAARTALVQEKAKVRDCLAERAREKASCNARQNSPCLMVQCLTGRLGYATSDENWFCLKTSNANTLQSVITEITDAEELKRVADAL